jgi:hypothetical protein
MSAADRRAQRRAFLLDAAFDLTANLTTPPSSFALLDQTSRDRA